MKYINFKNSIAAMVAVLAIMVMAPAMAFAASYGPTVETLGATDITEDSVVLNAYFTSRDAEYGIGDSPVLVFEYGETSSMGNATEGIPMWMGNRSRGVLIENLDEEEIYYFRAVLYTDDGIIRGDRVKFETKAEEDLRSDTLDVLEESNVVRDGTTQGDSVETQTQAQTASSTTSTQTATATTPTRTVATNTATVTTPLSATATTRTGIVNDGNTLLSIDNDEDVLRSGDVVTYDVTIENIADVELENVTLVIKIPEQMSVVSVSGARYNERGDEITVNVGDLKVGEDETIKVTARMRGRSSDDQVIARVDAIYGLGDIRNNVTSTAYDIDEYRGLNNNALGATAAGAGFFPTTIFGWILVILIILAIVAVARQYMLREKKTEGKIRYRQNGEMMTPVVE